MKTGLLLNASKMAILIAMIIARLEVKTKDTII